MDERAEVPKPTQQARSQATRARLVAAAGRCLIARGYAGASTATVAAEAAVSQGALFKHFPGKAMLLGACVEAQLAVLVTSFAADLGRRLGAGETSFETRLRGAVRALWGVFRQREMTAIFEVYVAARTDPVLEAVLAPLLQAHRQRILGQAARLFPEAAAHLDFEPVVDAVVYAMQGASLGLFAPDEGADERHAALFERMARHELTRLLNHEGETRCHA